NCDNCTFWPSRNEQRPHIRWNSSGTQTLSITVTNRDCPNEPRTQTVTIEVMPIPRLSISHNLTANTPLCQGNSLIATANYDSTATTRFQWFLNSIPGTSARTIKYENLTPITSNYRLEIRVTDNNLPQACRTLRDTLDFRVSPRPECNFRVSRSIISTSDTVTLIDFNTNQTQGATYTWNFDGGIEKQSYSSRKIIEFTTPGTKTISFTVKTPGCPEATCKTRSKGSKMR
ncbi:MAG: hypothetical protein RML72_12055, partial [Bacteroidia bacterium]|nr:hypothetical protein [Bacteroidia bacterium]MDW8159591.1 hypothetical protein [Bacteroidia bacterium]